MKFRYNNNILLINPWIHDFAAYNLWSRPLGLLYIAATLQHFGYKVHLIDCLNDYGQTQKQLPNGTGPFHSDVIEKPSVFNDIPRRYRRYGMPPEEFLSRLKELPGPSLICFTSHMTYWYPGVFEAIQLAKTVFPSVPVVLGGIYATLCYGHAKDNSGADYVIQGPGEFQVLKLADNLSDKKRDYGQFDTWLENEMVPAYGLYSKLNSVSMLTSRGCPLRCTYCATSLLGPGFNMRRPENVVCEIAKYVNNMRVKNIAFYDDALLMNSDSHIIPILKLLIKEGVQARYHTPNGIHPKYIDTSLAGLLWKAGFRTIRLGFEGTSQMVQKASKNKVNNRELEMAVHSLQSINNGPVNNLGDGFSRWDIGAYILIGLPGQTVEEVLDTIKYINKLGIKSKLSEYSPVPGTEEFQKALKLCPRIESDPLLHNKSTFTPLGMNIDYETFDKIKSFAKQLNNSIMAT